MYTFGHIPYRKQKHPNTYIPGEYLLLASDPAYGLDVQDSPAMPSFTFTHRYLTKRRITRNIRRSVSE